MMGSRSFDYGRLTSCSSNLSALAPPFTVDRYNPKPNSNPLWHYSDSPYVASINHNPPYPNSSSTLGPLSNSILDFEIPSALTTCPPTADSCQYSAAESSNPPTIYWPVPNPSAKPTIDALPYSSNSLPYYHEYVSPSASDSGYDMSTTPGLVSLSLASQVDYTGTLSGLEYTTDWGSFWNGFSGDKQGKQIELDGISCLEENNIAASLFYKNKTNQGMCSIIEQSHPQAPFLEPVTNTLQYIAHQKRLQTPNSHMSDCVSVSKSSPAPVIRPPPPVGTSSPASATFLPKTLDVGIIKAVNNEDFYTHSFVKAKVAAALSDEENVGCLDASGLSFHIKQNDHTSEASLTTSDELLNKPLNENSPSVSLKAKSTPHVPDIKVPTVFSIVIDGVDDNTTAKSTDCLDQHNLAVDSPCWKGAPDFHFLQSQVYEADNEQDLTKKSGTCSFLDLQEPQTSPCVGLCISSSKPCENNLSENICIENHFTLLQNKTSDANDRTMEPILDDDAKSGADLPQIRERIQFSADINKPKPGKEYDLSSESKCGSEPSHTKVLRAGDRSVTFTKIKSHDSIADTGMKSNEPLEDDNIPAVEFVSCLSSSVEYATQLAKPHNMETTAKMDVQLLINTMHNISDLLLLHCSTNSYDPTEREHGMLKHVIDNVHTCLPTKGLHVTPKPESAVPKGGTSIFKESRDHQMSTSAGQSQVNNKANFGSRHDSQHMLKEKGSYDASGKKVEKLMNFVSLMDDADISKRKSMVQAIRTILDEDFKSEEEMQPQALLYRNMWLEAEADLCSINCRSRLARMSFEMEKSRDVSKNTSAAQKLVSSDGLTDPNKPPSLPSNVKDGSLSKTAIPAKTAHIDDVEDSVMARFRVLKCRGEKSNSINMYEQLSELANNGFSGKSKSNQRPSNGAQLRDGIMNVASESHLWSHTGNVDKVGFCIHRSGHETFKDIQVGATVEPIVQAGRNNMVLCQRSPNSDDNTCLDWEHVLKDEFTWLN